jgi:hypothetical protein
MLRWALLVFLMSPAPPQTVSAQTALTVAPQHCVWRQGDDPDGKLGWAAANFDEPRPDEPRIDQSAWQPVASWSGLATPTPRFWLRCQFQPNDLAPIIQPVLQVSGDLAYEAFADGLLLGGSGNVLNGEHTVGVVRQYSSTAFARRDHPVVVALRMTFTPEIQEQQPLPEVTLGDGHMQTVEYLALVYGRVRAQWLTWTCYALIASAGPLFLVLFWFDRTQRYLLWIGLTCLLLATLRANELLWAASVHYPSRLEGFFYSVGDFVFVFQIEFFFALNRRPVTKFFRGTQVLVLLNRAPLLVAAFLPVDWNMRLYWVFDVSKQGAFIDILSLLLGCLTPLFAFRPLRTLRRWQVGMFAVCSFWQLTDAVYLAVQLPLTPGDFNEAFQHIQPYRSVAIAAVVVALTLLIVQRQRADSRQRAMLEGEMQAARQIQQMLVSATLETAPGLEIEAAFRPAKEVGGDFYRCRVLAGGTQRILLGDVSGKGAAAAMTAAMLLGAAEGHEEGSPSALMAHLNAAFKKSGLGGFATCLCLDIATDGVVSFANAGQIPPYRNGAETPCDSGLPLGIVEDTEYAEATLKLALGDQLTILSDGVLEARDPATGELFGFERTAAISAESAETIASAAQAFGQDDDITVLTVVRVA